MDFTTVESVSCELLGKTRKLRLTLMAPIWYKKITGKSMDALIMVLQRQLAAGMAAKRVNDAHAEALGVPVDQLPPDEVVDPNTLLEEKDRVDIEDMVTNTMAAVYALAHWEDVAARPQGKKDIALPGELTYEDMGTGLDLDAYPQLMIAIVEVYGLHAMKAGKDTAGADPNAKSPVPQSSGLSEDASSDSVPTNS